MSDAGAASPASVEFFDELSRWAAARRWPSETIAYAGDSEREADLRLPSDGGPFPVAVLLHGGFWRARYTRSTLDALAVALAAEGWATWNVEYRRVGRGGGVPATLDDVAAAITAVHRLDAPLNLACVVALGHSAGGQLALWAAANGGLAGAVSIAGVCDLTEAATRRLGDGAVVDFVGAPPGRDPAAYELADPARRVPTGVRQLLVHGTADDVVPVALSRGYVEKARAAGDACDLLELEGCDHFEPIDPRTAAWRTTSRRIRQLWGGES